MVLMKDELQDIAQTEADVNNLSEQREQNSRLNADSGKPPQQSLNADSGKQAQSKQADSSKSVNSSVEAEMSRGASASMRKSASRTEASFYGLSGSLIFYSLFPVGILDQI